MLAVTSVCAAGKCICRHLYAPIGISACASVLGLPARVPDAAPLTYASATQIVDPSILKQYIFQKGFVTDAAKAKREAEAQNATLQACSQHECGPQS